MNDHALLMRKAKSQLQGQWGEAAIAGLIFVLVTYLFSNTIVLGMLLLGPVTMGYYLYLGCLADRHQSNFSLMYKPFTSHRFMEFLIAGLLYFLIVWIGCLLLFVPGIIAACGLSMTFYIMMDDPNISGIEALKKSWNMMSGNGSHGYKWDFFCLQLRFIGWYLLAFLTCGIGMCWLSPYITVTNLNYYRKLKYGVY